MHTYPSKIELLDLNEISPNSWNCNAMDREEFKKLVSGMSITGPSSMAPIICRRLRDGGYEIIDGEHRYRAAKLLGWKKVPAFITEMNEEEAKVNSLLLNYSKGRLDPLRLFDLLYNEWEGGRGKLSTRQIVEKYGKVFDQSWVVRVLSLRKLGPKVRRFLEVQRELNGGRTPLSLKHLILISKISDEELQLKLVKAVIETKISVEALQRVINSKRLKTIFKVHKGGKKRKLRRTYEESIFKCPHCDSEILVDWNKMKAYLLEDFKEFKKKIELVQVIGHC